MLQGIAGGELPGSDAFPYRKAIEEHGGILAVANELLRFIEPDIRCLEGSKVSRENLEKIQKKQGMWLDRESSVGYCDYITDTRNPEYVRLYIGQTKSAERRILLQHIQAIRRGDHSSLHYFILWLGNGHRTANFLRLWSFSNEQEDSWSQMCSNFLESLFCIAFSTHHGCLSKNQSENGFGLNIISPLVQSVRMMEHEKAQYSVALKGAGDPQIAAWLSFRQSFKERSKCHMRQPPWSRHDYMDAFRDALGSDELFEYIKSSCGTPKPNASLSTAASPELIGDASYFGSLSATLGFVLDNALATRHSEQMSPVEANESFATLPWSLEGCHFHERNVVVWTHDFRPFSTLSVDSLKPCTSAESDQIRNKHRMLINAGQARVIVLCGPLAEKMILEVVCPYQSYFVELRGHRYAIHVGTSGAAPERILCIQCPQLPSQIWSIGGEHAAKVSEAVKFASLLTNLDGIRPYFLEGSSALGVILRQREREKQGAPKMTTETLDDGLYLWLCRKGFSDIQDIRRLEEICGSLMQGLVELLHALPRRQDNKPQLQPTSLSVNQRKRKSPHHLDPAVRDAAQRHCKRVIDEREARFQQDEAVHDDESQLIEQQDSCDFSSEETISEFFQAPDAQSTSFALVQRHLATVQIAASANTGNANTLEQGVLPNELQEFDQEALIDDLNRLAEHMDLTPFRSVKVSRKEWQIRRYNWRMESTNFRHHKYCFIVPNSKVREITIGYCRVTIPTGFDAGDGRIFVTFEVSPDGTSLHPHAYASSATDIDIARLLAIKINGRDSNQNYFAFYATVAGEKALFRANAFADILLKQRSNIEIAKSPRRYLYFRKGTAPDALKQFEGGRYTSPC